MRKIEQKTNQDKTTFNNIYITKHFMERYNLRVSKSEIVLSAIDILNKEDHPKEKNVLGLFKKNRVIIPMGCFELVIKKYFDNYLLKEVACITRKKRQKEIIKHLMIY